MASQLGPLRPASTGVMFTPKAILKTQQSLRHSLSGGSVRVPKSSFAHGRESNGLQRGELMFDLLEMGIEL